jgi:hypothetical protein
MGEIIPWARESEEDEEDEEDLERRSKSTQS